MLESAIEQLLTVIGVVTFDTNYYDFRYPNATNLMLIAEAIYDGGSDSFEFKLPSDFTYYERSWTHVFHHAWYDASTLYLNDTEISIFDSHGQQNIWLFEHGTFTPADLPPGVFHTILVDLNDAEGDAFGGIALTYQEVP
jgi:hypothetical protein